MSQMAQGLSGSSAAGHFFCRSYSNFYMRAGTEDVVLRTNSDWNFIPTLPTSVTVFLRSPYVGIHMVVSSRQQSRIQTQDWNYPMGFYWKRILKGALKKAQQFCERDVSSVWTNPSGQETACQSLSYIHRLVVMWGQQC
jgi:hypothetical protein